MHDTKDEVYSLAIKRLNQTDDMQIVIEQSLLTDKFMVGVPDGSRDRLQAYMDYLQIKNKTNKINLYREWFYKAYANTGMILIGLLGYARNTWNW